MHEICDLGAAARFLAFLDHVQRSRRWRYLYPLLTARAAAIPVLTPGDLIRQHHRRR